MSVYIETNIIGFSIKCKSIIIHETETGDILAKYNELKNRIIIFI